MAVNLLSKKDCEPTASAMYRAVLMVILSQQCVNRKLLLNELETAQPQPFRPCEISYLRLLFYFYADILYHSGDVIAFRAVARALKTIISFPWRVGLLAQQAWYWYCYSSGINWVGDSRITGSQARTKLS